MNYLSELEFEKEKARLLKTYNCETLDEVIEYLKLQIKMQTRQKLEKCNPKGE